MGRGARETAGRRTYLIVNALKVTGRPSTVYDVYLNLPDSATAADRKLRRMGQINFFDFQIELAHVHFGQVKNIADQLQQVFTAGENLGEVGFGLAKEWLAEEVAAKPVTIIGDSPRVDILTVAWSVHYPEAARDATVFTVEGVKVPAASIEHLIASKRTGRLQDAADIEVLEEIRRLRG